MLHLVPILSTVLPVIASSLLFVVLTLSLYLKIRRKFRISVNCWFCNSWTKVHYDDRNSFDCPTCLQYNGFKKDGDYNKVIPEQHDELMNKSSRIKRNKSIVANGLCALCNNNQRLKIFQLANFVPLVEENYDVEIEHFETQLEKAYKLCKKCDRVLRKTLDKQKAWIFGNRIKNLCSNGFAKITNQIKKETKLSLLGKLDGFLSTMLVFAVIVTTLSSIKVFTKNLSTHVPTAYLPLYKMVISAANNSRVFQFDLFAPYFSKSIKIEPYSVICGAGLVVQTGKLIWSRFANATKVNQLLCWVILFLISWVRFNKNYSSYVLFLEAFSCVYLLSTAFTKEQEKKHTQKVTGKAMRKLVKNLEYTCTDASETSDFENISRTSSRDSSDFSKSFSSLDVPLQNHTAGNVLNSSFTSAKSRDIDLNKSLNNLHLGGLGFKSPQFALKRPKPVLSPPKFQNVNSWVAGGFWRDADGVVMPMAQRTNLSRSSSESSGFGSQHNEFVPPKNYFGDFDKASMNSEFTRLSPSPTFLFAPPEYRRNCFYPSLIRVGSPGFKYNEPYQFANWSDKVNSQATQSFRDLSLRSKTNF